LDPVLAFDTAAAHCAAALLCGDRIVAIRHEPMAKGQAERLLPLLEELLAEAGIGWRDLAALGVGIGPGNFTGIRISVAAARGIALARGIPAMGVSGLEAQVYGTGRAALASLDARRDAAYVQAFDAMGQPLAPPDMGDPATLALPDLPAPPLCLGPAAAALALRTGGTSGTPATPQAEAIARIAAARAQPALPPPIPLYIRPADAAPAKPAPALLRPR
jgi:tRNA threonylcarbamoyl adenosine modification protein YeaZ